ncbi:MAG: hypothetical protein KIT27_10810 [Legionellales bacterium]|nr:hypothetical protein [Legionellales bacterium]
MFASVQLKKIKELISDYKDYLCTEFENIYRKFALVNGDGEKNIDTITADIRTRINFLLMNLLLENTQNGNEGRKQNLFVILKKLESLAEIEKLYAVPVNNDSSSNITNETKPNTNKFKWNDQMTLSAIERKTHSILAKIKNQTNTLHNTQHRSSKFYQVLQSILHICSLGLVSYYQTGSFQFWKPRNVRVLNTITTQVSLKQEVNSKIQSSSDNTDFILKNCSLKISQPLKKHRNPPDRNHYVKALISAENAAGDLALTNNDFELMRKYRRRK